MLPKADQEALHPDAATLVLELHHGYTARMVCAPAQSFITPSAAEQLLVHWKKAC